MSEVTIYHKAPQVTDIPVRTFGVRFPETPLIIDGDPYEFIADPEAISSVVELATEKQGDHTYPLSGLSVEFEKTAVQLSTHDSAPQIYNPKLGYLKLTLPPSLVSNPGSDFTEHTASQVERTLGEQIARGLITRHRLHNGLFNAKVKIATAGAIGTASTSATGELLLQHDSAMAQYASGLVLGTLGLIGSSLGAAAAIRKTYDPQKRAAKINQKIAENGINKLLSAEKEITRLVDRRLVYVQKAS